jgi:hypothetical protein
VQAEARAVLGGRPTFDTAAIVDLAATTSLSRGCSDLQGANDNSRLAPVSEAAESAR